TRRDPFEFSVSVLCALPQECVSVRPLCAPIPGRDHRRSRPRQLAVFARSTPHAYGGDRLQLRAVAPATRFATFRAQLARLPQPVSIRIPTIWRRVVPLVSGLPAVSFVVVQTVRRLEGSCPEHGSASRSGIRPFPTLGSFVWPRWLAEPLWPAAHPPVA